MNVSPAAWKRIALISLSFLCVLILAGVLYWTLAPRLNAGVQALQYLEACIEAEICPAGTFVSQKLAAKRAAQTSPSPTTVPTPTPSTAAPPAEEQRKK